jgi:hypothetical protein
MTKALERLIGPARYLVAGLVTWLIVESGHYLIAAVAGFVVVASLVDDWQQRKAARKDRARVSEAVVQAAANGLVRSGVEREEAMRRAREMWGGADG